jgi:hypothetical protein
MTQQIKPISPAQQGRIQALMDRGIVSGPMPQTSWEASCVIRNAVASKRDKDQLKSKGGRVLARMTSSEVEMTSKVLDALALIDGAGVKNAKVLEGAMILRSMFCSKAQ